MELSIRDWMLVIGVLLLLAVALDGYRRARRERQHQVRLSRNAKRAARNRKADADAAFPSELPNGGARVIGGAAEDEIDPLNPPEIPSERLAFQERQEPVLNDPPEPEAEVAVAEEPENRAEAELHAEPEDDEEDYAVDPLFANPFETKPAKSREPKVVEQPGLFDQADAGDDGGPEEILVLNVLAANKEGFAGEDLMHILLACDCRFGEMNIFHRYEKENKQGKIQFSIVNLVEPGIFDLDDIKSFTTPGISFFIRLPGPENPLEAYDAMVETAKCLARNLQGLLKDENHSTATEQTLEHGRQRIRDYLKRKLISV